MLTLKNSPYGQCRQENATLLDQAYKDAILDIIKNQPSEENIVNKLTVKNKNLTKVYLSYNFSIAGNSGELDLNSFKSTILNLLQYTSDDCLFALQLSVPSRCVPQGRHAIPLIFNKKGELVIYVSKMDYKPDIEVIIDSVKETSATFGYPINKIKAPFIPQNDKTFCLFYSFLALTSFTSDLSLFEQIENVTQKLQQSTSSTEEKLKLQNEIVDKADNNFIRIIQTNIPTKTRLYDQTKAPLTASQLQILMEILQKKLDSEYYEVTQDRQTICIRQIKETPRGSAARLAWWNEIYAHFEIKNSEELYEDENNDLIWQGRTEICFAKSQQDLTQIVGEDHLFLFLKSEPSSNILLANNDNVIFSAESNMIRNVISKELPTIGFS